MPRWVIFISLLIFFEAVADIFATERSLHNKKWIIAIAAIFFYIVCNTFWLFALKNGSGLAKGSIIFSVASGIIGTILGYYLYKEHISAFQFTGILLGIVSIIFVNLE